jgi:hypothetical protein
MKTKAEIVKHIEESMDGGADAIYESLLSTGCIEPPDHGEEDKEDEGYGSSSDQKEEPKEPSGSALFMIGKKDNAKDARKKSAGFASKMMGGM